VEIVNSIAKSPQYSLIFDDNREYRLSNGKDSFVAEIRELEWNDVVQRAARLADLINQDILAKESHVISIHLYGVPRGGIYAAMAIASEINHKFDATNVHAYLTEDANSADYIVDDIVDTGATREYYKEEYEKPFISLVDKTKDRGEYCGHWVSFPWERMQNDQGPLENVRRLIEYIGDDPKREGLLETPSRVLRSYETLFSGYKQNPEDVIKVFEDGACNEMVLLKGVEFASFCEHHILPFIGQAHIAYIPNGKVIGVSKLVRILEIYARRLQIQERIGEQVTECLMKYLQPKGAACVLSAKHLCMSCRGVEKQHSTMITSSLKGVFLEDARTRSEFLSMIKGD
jgi:GTP cyclohydrolase I